MKTVRIDGIDYPFYGMTEDRHGIITEDRTFWMFPDCHADGAPVVELPRIGPREIKRVSFDEPDLTETHLDEVKADHERYLDYWRNVTPEDHAREYGLLPGKEQDEEDAAYAERVKLWIESFRPGFEEGRKQLLAVSLDDYRTDTGKHNAWIRHGTPDLAERHNFRDYTKLYIGLSAHGVNRETVIPRIFSLSYEAHYPDPEGGIIFLKDILPDMHTPAALRHVEEYQDLMLKAKQEAAISEAAMLMAAKRTLRRLMNDGKLQSISFACWCAYVSAGTLKKARDSMKHKLHPGKIAEHVHLCEELSGIKVVKEARGGRGVHRENVFQDQLESLGVTRADNPTFDEVCRRLDGEDSQNEE